MINLTNSIENIKVNSARHSLIRKKTVGNELIFKIKTYKAPGKEIKNDWNLIRNMIIWGFCLVDEKWNPAYKMLIDSKMRIDVMHYPPPGGPSDKTIITTKYEYPDTPVIQVFNASKYKDVNLTRRKVFHEIMHCINHIGVKDDKGKIKKLSTEINKELDGKLDRIANNYKLGVLKTKTAEEVLTAGLDMYFASYTERMRLKEQEFALFDIINRMVVPFINKENK
ncbi:MAG: hypothetical protein ABIH00_08785 [Armatimonadota bacterium]